MNTLLYSPAAKQDLANIKKYIADELINPVATIRIVGNIAKQIRKLIKQPLIGTSLSSVVDLETDYRFLICGHYAVFYRFENKMIYIDRVLYGRRDFMKILFGTFADETSMETE